ncbi:MAG: type II and III secretion system protein [Planctomycetes bacterium]|nr:type II and III secretion system protein [Planctomycetota bacterium]
MHCLAEQEVQAQTGRTFIIEGMTKSREDVEHRFVGISLVAKPRVIESNKVNCLLCVESSKVDEENGVQLNEQFIPGLQKRRLQTEMSINDGEVFIIGMSTSTGDDNQKWSFVSAVTRIQKSDSKDGFSKSATPPATNEIPHKSTSESKP